MNVLYKMTSVTLHGMVGCDSSKIAKIRRYFICLYSYSTTEVETKSSEFTSLIKGALCGNY